MERTILCGFLILFCKASLTQAEDFPSQLKPLFQVVDLNVDESADVTLSDGSQSPVRLVNLKKFRDSVCFAVRRAEVTVEVNGQTCQLVSANYNLPRTLGQVQIDCPITKG